MNKKISLIIVICASSSFAACGMLNWNLVDTCNEGARRCYTSNVQVCLNGQWVLETKCQGDAPICGSVNGMPACVANPSSKCVRPGDDTEYDLGSSFCGEDGKLYECVTLENGSSAFVGSDCPPKRPVCNVDEGFCRAYRKCKFDDGSATMAHGEMTCVENELASCFDGELVLEADCEKRGKVCDTSTASCVDPTAYDCEFGSMTIPDGAATCYGDKILRCTRGGIVQESCATHVPNASGACMIAGNAVTCGFVCNSDSELSEDGLRCEKMPKFDNVLAIRKAYDRFVDPNACRMKETRNTVKRADVRLTGIVTSLHNSGFYVQDTQGGIRVVCPDKSCMRYANGENVAVGDKVSVVSNGIGQRNCDLQIQPVKGSSLSVEKIASNQNVFLDMVVVEDLTNNGPRNLNLGKLVRLSGAEVTDHVKQFWKVKQGNSEITISPNIIGKNVLNTALNVGRVYSITGIGIYAANEVRLAPCYVDDIVEECANGSFRCNPTTNQFETCYWGQWQEARSCSEFNYASAGGSSVNATMFACNANNSGCVITQCAPGYRPTQNGMACEIAGRVNNCSLDIRGNKPSPGTAFCDSEYSWNSCSPTGYDEGARPCRAGEFCNPATINTTFKCEKRTSSACNENELKCRGKKNYSICIDGQWIDGTTQPGQKCVNNRLTCKVSEFCNNNQWYTCDSRTGNVSPGVDCKLNASGNTVCGTRLNECVPPQIAVP